MITLKPKLQALKVWWLTQRQVYITKTAIAALERERHRLWLKIDRMTADKQEIDIRRHRVERDSEAQVINLLWHSLNDQIKALWAQRLGVDSQIATYELFLVKVKHKIWHPLTGFKRSDTSSS